MLFIALVMSGLWLLRIAFTHDFHYWFILANIGLAAIPVLLEPLFILTTHRLRGMVTKIAQVFLGLVWLLFLPNSFYVLTDFMHINPTVLVNERNNQQDHLLMYARGDGIYIFDSLFLFVATAISAYLGGLALFHGYRFIRTKVAKWYALALLSFVMFLVGAGVYIGRYGRWNSWEGLVHPWRIVHDLLSDLASAPNRQRFVIVVTAMVVLQVISFLYVRQQSYFSTNSASKS